MYEAVFGAECRPELKRRIMALRAEGDDPHRTPAQPRARACAPRGCEMAPVERAGAAGYRRPARVSRLKGNGEGGEP
jgi:hypothetical protein